MKKVITGIKRRVAKPVSPKSPLSFDILAEVLAVATQRGSLLAWRTLWRINMEFFALLRWEEVANLRVQDIKFHGNHMDIFIKKSKTDQLRRGASVRVARHWEKPHACPVNITLIYIRMLKYSSGQNGLMQPRIITTKHGQAGAPDSRLSYSRALQDLKDMIEATGRDSSSYGEHSGRRGGATAAAEAGAEWTDLKRLGRWASDTAPQLYVENTERKKSRLPDLLAREAQKDRSDIESRLTRLRVRPPALTQGGSGMSTSVTRSAQQDTTLSVMLPRAEPRAPEGPLVGLPQSQ